MPPLADYTEQATVANTVPVQESSNASSRRLPHLVSKASSLSLDITKPRLCRLGTSKRLPYVFHSTKESTKQFRASLRPRMVTSLATLGNGGEDHRCSQVGGYGGRETNPTEASHRAGFDDRHQKEVRGYFDALRGMGDFDHEHGYRRCRVGLGA